jgi:ribose transport system permease protein
MMYGVDRAAPADGGPSRAGNHGIVESARAGLAHAVGNASLLFIWAGLIILFGLLEPSKFLSVDTLRTVMADQAITAIMALALLLPVAANQFDLSISGSMGLALVLAGTLMADTGLPVPVAILATLVAGLVIGMINAIAVVKVGINSFIATLGTGSILLAAQEWLSDNKIITTGIPAGFKDLGRQTLFTIPLPFFYMLAISVVLWFVLEYRQVGRYLYAIGSNVDAARLAGVRVDRLRGLALIVSATIASLAGVVFLGRIGATSVNAGAPYLLPAFASVFLGATQFKDGRVNVVGTLVAVYVLATGVKGVQLLGAPLWVENLFNGCALLIAVGLAVRSGRQRTSSV